MSRSLKPSRGASGARGNSSGLWVVPTGGPGLEVKQPGARVPGMSGHTRPTFPLGPYAPAAGSVLTGVQPPGPVLARVCLPSFQLVERFL